MLLAAWPGRTLLQNSRASRDRRSLMEKTARVSSEILTIAIVSICLSVGGGNSSSGHTPSAGLKLIQVNPPSLPDWKFLGTPMAGQADTAVSRLVVDPRDERILYVGTDRGLYVSRDGGGSW